MDPLVITDGVMDPDELLDVLEGGRRVVVHTEFLGQEHEVTLRRDDDVFYCDTPTPLHKHESRAEMRTCLVNQIRRGLSGRGPAGVSPG